ncbi:GroES-like protein [Polyporus arcularius HHB13444]|uniref:GroES-like protein n=1 Tax=Polyporus arcularius HHB13444 TaxID=1314778 RepID=A0A5C3NSQ8_9APHY|nr:GroES-like protein [Polyporus arcularius HHB13444]
MAPTTQKALGLPAEGERYKLFNDWPTPTPGPNDVLVKVISAALNPGDWKIEDYGVAVIGGTYPYIGGLDGAGVVEEVGSQVKNLIKGDRVLFSFGINKPERATFQQYSVQPAENVGKIPDNITFDQAASVPLCLATVATGIWSHGPGARSVGFPAPWEEGGLTKYQGQAALIVGGSSSIGQYAIQLAKLQGFSPIITTSSLKHADYLKSLGATHVLDRSLSPKAIATELQKLTGGQPITYAYDAIADETTQHIAYDAVALGGALVLSNYPGQWILAEKVKRDGGAKKLAYPFADLQIPENKQLGVELYERLEEWLRSGIVVPNRIELLPGGLNGIPGRLERLKANQVSGVKLVVRPQETA